MESVSAEAIEQLCKGSGVIVKDVNFPEVEKLQEKLVTERRWNDLFRGKLQATATESAVMHRTYGSVVAHAKTICRKFEDVLPIETCGQEDAALEVDNVKLIYNGPRDPVTRMDELAFDLLSLVKRSVDVQVVGHEGKEEHAPLKRKRYRCRG
ncbi:unnamed protein product [Urochloa humidicola]